MNRKQKRLLFTVVLLIMAAAAFSFSVFAAGEDAEHVSNMYSTIWALVPPVVAIVLALITKEVYSSLFIGIITGALFYSNFDIGLSLNTIISDGLIGVLADPGDVGILLFLVLLGVLVVLMNRAGGSAAYGKYASEKFKTKRGILGATFGLGVLIFVDDYFNCLTVGSVMRPATDKFGVSRAKLAYLIDATAAPICMIAPISSWAAAVAGVVEDYNGFQLFVRAIPYNFYSLLTIVAIIVMTAMRFDFGKMAIHERNAEKGDLYTVADRPYSDDAEKPLTSKGRVIDLVLPVAVLIISCIIAMIYTGGFFEGASLIDAFGDCDATYALPLGTFITLVFTIIYYLCRKVLNFKQCMTAVPEGFKAMVPAIIILTLAWALSTMTGMLGAKYYVAELITGSAKALQLFLPAIIFLIAVFLSFSTGTSWGTFAILIPIITGVFSASDPLLIIGISACLAGAVCGDHCSPISDTTIMASTGAQCDHVAHVSTQLPYAMMVAGVSFVSYIIAGLVRNVWIALPVAIVLMLATIFVIKRITSKKSAKV